MRVTYLICVSLVCSVACDSDNAAGAPAQEDSFQDDDLPMGGCGGTACPDSDPTPADGATAPVGNPCDGANQCESGVCAASFSGARIGDLVCQTACVEVMDEGMWCSDSATCCGTAVCSSRGYCVVDQSAGDSSGESTSDSTGGGTGANTDGDAQTATSGASTGTAG